jgi:hypothetical protein
MSFEDVACDPCSAACTPIPPGDGTTSRVTLANAAKLYFETNIRPDVPTLTWPLSREDAAVLAHHNQAKYVELRKKMTQINEHSWSQLQPHLASDITIHNKYVLVYDGVVADTMFDTAIAASIALDTLQLRATWHPQLPLIRKVAGSVGWLQS